MYISKVIYPGFIDTTLGTFQPPSIGFQRLMFQANTGNLPEKNGHVAFCNHIVPQKEKLKV